MKTKILLVVASLTLGLIGRGPAEEAPSGRPGAPGRGGGHGNPEEREKMRESMQKVMTDPRVQAAMEERRAAGEAYLDAVSKAILAQDASLQPALDKVQKAKEEMKQRAEKFREERRAGGGPGRGGPDGKREGKGFGGPGGRFGQGPFGGGQPGGELGGPLFSQLDQADKDKLSAAMARVKELPDVKAAADRRDKSVEAFHETMKSVMAGVDPSLAEKAERMQKRWQEGGRGFRKDGGKSPQPTPAPTPSAT